MKDITGATAVACVVGTVLALGANAVVIQLVRSALRMHVRRQRAPFHGDYSTPKAAQLDKRLLELEKYTRGLTFQVAMLSMSLFVTVLLYGGLWLELIRGEEPAIDPTLFGFVVLVDGSMMLGASISAWQERPR